MARIDAFLDVLLARNGTDLHLAVGSSPMIRARGDLVSIRVKEIDRQEIEALLLEILTPAQKRRIAEELDLELTHAHGEKARFRASYFHKSSGLAAVFRIMPTTILSLAELGCPDAIRGLAERRAGLCLVTGPAESGKSTTLAAMIAHINQTRSCTITTIEDPIELVHRSIKAQITQREIGAHAASFVGAIRSAAREDAEVILVGDLRAAEAMKLALQLASSGVLVLGEVSASSAAAALDGILRAFPAEQQWEIRGMLAENLLGVVAQRLLRTADSKGRVAAHEILLGGGALATMIREGTTFQAPSLMQREESAGMQTMDRALERLVARGAITVEAGLEKAMDKEGFPRGSRAEAPG